MTGYNYAKFSAEHYDLVTFRGPEPGHKAPDVPVETLDGKTRSILDFDGPFLVLELGSITCPLFQSRRGAMGALVRAYPQLSFAVLYVREAHPGANIPAHQSHEDKLNSARRLRDQDGEGRQILIDDLAGTAHQAFGGYPNALFIINRNGCVVYRSAWNNPSATRRVLKNLLNGRSVRSESLFRPPLPPVARKTLKMAGRGAGRDFFASLASLIWNNLIRRNLSLLLRRRRAVAPDVRC